MSQALFRRCLEHVLEAEGGFVDHPVDPGGATNRGVTQRVYDAWRRSQGLEERSVRDLEEAELEALYLTRYWEPSKAGELGWPAALWHFDAAVNSGVRRAAKLLQEAVGARPDGNIGPKTRAAVERAAASGELPERLRWIRILFYARIVQRRPASAVFLVGWLRRVRRLEATTAERPALE